jgi:hypothetical protein
MNDITGILKTLMVLSTKFPDIELRLTIQDGELNIGIPKGECGSAFAAAWGNPDGLYKIPAGAAERN